MTCTARKFVTYDTPTDVYTMLTGLWEIGVLFRTVSVFECGHGRHWHFEYSLREGYKGQDMRWNTELLT